MVWQWQSSVLLELRGRSIRSAIKMRTTRPALPNVLTVWYDVIQRKYFSFSGNISGLVVARGCATKAPVFYVECENHQSKRNIEEFCYCSFNFCNSHSNSGGVITTQSFCIICLSLFSYTFLDKKL